MSQEVTNFARFYAAFKYLPYYGDRENLKQLLVLHFTDGRTNSLREIKPNEYKTLCRSIESLVSIVSQEDLYKLLKRRRSAVLHQMQIYGVDTTNWENVDKFCLNPRITGKKFRELEIEELEQLYKKLKMMIKKQNEQ